MSDEGTCHLSEERYGSDWAGRTDAGVHASLMVAHFDYEGEPLDVDKVAEKLNRLLPQDISVYKVCRVKPDAHARFDATARTYKYYITTVKFPFNRQYRYRIHNPLDFQKMNEAALTLFHYSDFTSFSKLHTDVKPIFVRLCMPNGLRRMNIPGCLPSRRTAFCVIWYVPLSVRFWKWGVANCQSMTSVK